MRVLFVASEPEGSATYRYRSENLARCLCRAGHEAEMVYVGDSRVRVEADVVVLHRVCTVPEGLAFARAARKIGAVLVYSTDDTVFDAGSFPESGDPWDAIRAFAPRHAEMIAEADAVLSSTDYIAAQIRRIFGADKPVFTVRNFLSGELLALSEAAERKREPGDFVTFGYMSGSATHNADFAVVAPALYELLTTHENTRLLVAGTLQLDNRFLRLERVDKLLRVPFTPWRDLPEIVAQTSVNLSPLNLRCSFVRGKSEIKFLEAAAAGVPTVATATEGFIESVPADAVSYCTDNQNWLDSLQDLLDPDTRRAQADRAYAHTLTHGTEEVNAAHVAETFQAIAALPRQNKGGKGNGEHTTSAVWVNTPFAPPKYLAKAILRRLGR